MRTNQAAHIINGREFLFVQVPSDAENIDVEEFDVLVYDFINDNLEIAQGFLNLPPDPNKLIGSWKLIGTSESMSEEQASELVPKDMGVLAGFVSDTERLKYELLPALGLDPINKTIVILEKEK